MIKVADPDILLCLDGRLVVNAASLPLAERHGRRVIRCVELTDGEQAELRHRLAEVSGDLLVALPGSKRGGR